MTMFSASDLRDNHHFPGITLVRLSFQHPTWETGCSGPHSAQNWMCPVNPLPLGQTPTSYLPSEQVTCGAWLSEKISSESRFFIPPVLVRVRLADDEYKRPSTVYGGFELSRLLLSG